MTQLNDPRHGRAPVHGALRDEHLNHEAVLALRLRSACRSDDGCLDTACQVFLLTKEEEMQSAQACSSEAEMLFSCLVSGCDVSLTLLPVMFNLTPSASCQLTQRGGKAPLSGLQTDRSQTVLYQLGFLQRKFQINSAGGAISDHQAHIPD